MDSFYTRHLRPWLFKLPPESAHIMALKTLSLLGRWSGPLLGVKPFHDDRLTVRMGPWTFANPVGLAAGFDKDAVALRGLASLGFGFLEVGTLTPRPQPGNPRPRLFRYPEEFSLINQMGFNNQGAVRAAQRRRKAGPLSIPVGFNLGKNRDTPIERATEDYASALETVFDGGDFFVVNVSSPNTKGLRSLQNRAQLAPLLTAVRRRALERAQSCGRASPLLFVKVSPDEGDYLPLVEEVLAAQFDGIIATNTTQSREGLPNRVPREGGASGGVLRGRSLDVIKRLHKLSKGKLRLIGVGGIMTPRDAYDRILAGAHLIEVYTGLVYQGPAWIPRLLEGLLTLCVKDGFSNISKAVGQAA